jgi:hypothetical protein
LSACRIAIQWQGIFGIHKPGHGGVICVRRAIDPESYILGDEAEDAANGAVDRRL